MRIGVPANEVVNFAARANLFPLERFGEVHGDAAMRESLARFGRLPARHGALLQSVAVHRPNELYDTSLQMYVVEGPGGRETKLAEEMFDDARYTDLRANLLWFEERYRRILARPQQGGGWLHGDDWDEEQARFREYVAAQRAEVEGLLEALDATAPPTP
jgi:hypothetical protein